MIYNSLNFAQKSEVSSETKDNLWAVTLYEIKWKQKQITYF